MTQAVLGIIGGSGIYDLPGLEGAHEEVIKSPWGEPSAPLRRGSIAGLPIVFLPRHDKGHRLSPSGHQLSGQYRRAEAGRCHRPDLALGMRLLQRGDAAGHFRSRRPVRPIAPTSAKARSSAGAASRMCRWRTRSRRGCASILQQRPEPRVSRSRAAALMSAIRTGTK